MRRLLIIALLVVVALLVLTAGVATWLVHDEALLRAQLSRLVLTQTGRELRIGRPLVLSLGRLTTLEAGGIALANADWADNPEMVRIGHLKVTVDVPSLFGGPPHLPLLELGDCAVELIRNDAGEPNWAPFAAGDDAPEDHHEAGALPRIDQLAIDDCSLTLDGPERSRALAVEIAEARLAQVGAGRIEGHVDGRLDGEDLAVRGWLEPLGAFQRGGPLHHELELRAGRVVLESSGTVADALTFSEPDIRTRFSGPAIERILEQHALPALSEGPFDFRASLATRDGRAVVDIDGDFGTLDVTAEGEFDALRRPRDGHIRGKVHGADLQAVAQALGFDLPVGEAFDGQADFRFGDERIELREARLQTAGETLALSGTLSSRPQWAGSSVDLSVDSAEIGRWLPLAGRPEQALGPLRLEGTVRVDDNGQVAIDGTARQAGSVLTARGGLGPIDHPVSPDLDFRFETEDTARLAAMLGLETFPTRSLRMQGHASRAGQKVTISDLETWLGPHHALADATIVLDPPYRGSELDLVLEIPDLADFGALFGKPGLPQEAVQLQARLWPDGPGLGFRVDKAEMGEIRLALDGRIADLAEPAGVDARFDLRFPDGSILGLWLPQLDFPPGAFHATGVLDHRGDRTRLDGVKVALGDVLVQLDGDFSPQWELDFQVRVAGPDLSALDGLARTSLPPVPFDASSKLAGTPSALNLDELAVTAGRSDLHGALALRRSDMTRIETTLKGARVNLDHWLANGKDDAPAEKDRRFVFDETPVMTLSDLGLELDAKLRVDVLEVGPVRYNDLDIGIVLTDQRLVIDPYALEGFNEGRIRGRLSLDRTGPAPLFNLEANGSDTRLTLGAAEGQDPRTLPLGDYRIELHGRGHTRREMASSLDGRVRLDFGPGKLVTVGNAFLVSDFLTELLRTLNPWSKSQEFTQLECAVAAADITSGQVAIGPVVFHAEQVTVLAQGGIDLGTEKIDLSFNSKQRKGLGISASDLVNPFIKIGGTLARPSLELDPAGTVAKGGLAVATAGLSIVATSIAERHLSSKDPCGDALKTIHEKDSGER